MIHRGSCAEKCRKSRSCRILDMVIRPWLLGVCDLKEFEKHCCKALEGSKVPVPSVLSEAHRNLRERPTNKGGKLDKGEV